MFQLIQKLNAALRVYWKREWRKFQKDRTGAVTVMVTLLLVPSILVSGTAVDLARIYTAKSSLENGNTMALNGVLASYDSLLQDLYGLFAVAQDDKLQIMVEEYIVFSLYGDSAAPKGSGTLQTFYGSDTVSVELTPTENYHLANKAILRRQIEEYAKFRAPIAIVERLQSLLDVFDKVAEDTKLIEQKTEIDDGMEDLYEIYEEIYQYVLVLDTFPTTEENVFYTINNRLTEINSDLYDIYEVMDDYKDATASDDTVLQDDLSDEFISITVRIGYTAEDFIEIPAKTASKEYDKVLDAMEEIISLGKKANKKKEDIAANVAEMNQDLDAGKGNAQLNASLKEVMPQYKDLLSSDFEDLGQRFFARNEAGVLESQTIIENVAFCQDSRQYESNDFSMAELKRMDNTLSINIEEDFYRLRGFFQPDESNFTYTRPNKYTTFVNCGTDFAEAYDALNKLFVDNDSSEKAKTAKKNITKLLGVIQDMYDEMFVFDPQGNLELTVSSNSGSSTPSIDSSGTWEYKGNQKSLLTSLSTIMGDSMSDASNKMLLMTYGIEMFSNYATNRSPGDDGGEPPDAEADTSMSGTPLTKDNNFLYQSEVEYLFKGNNKAVENLEAVYGLIFAIRLVLNYTDTFRVPEVSSTLTTISASVPVVGFLVAEAARLAFAMGESVLDLRDLRNGLRVPMIKDSGTWKLSVSSILEMEAGDIKTQLDNSEGQDDGTGFSYDDYIYVFLLFVDGDVLAQRMSDLIQANINWQEEDTEKGSFKMSEAYTDYDITAKVEMRFLFLSLPMAQQFNSDVSAPTTFPVVAYGSRGY